MTATGYCYASVTLFDPDRGSAKLGVTKGSRSSWRILQSSKPGRCVCALLRQTERTRDVARCTRPVRYLLDLPDRGRFPICSTHKLVIERGNLVALLWVGSDPAQGGKAT